MKLEKGRIVCSIAGRDKGSFLVIFSADDKNCFVCDGKERPIERPKSKRIKHIAPTKTCIAENQMATNRELRKALKAFVEKINEPI